MVLVQHDEIMAFSRAGHVFLQRAGQVVQTLVSTVNDGGDDANVPQYHVLQLKFNQNATILAALCDNKTILTWNIETKQEQVKANWISIPRKALTMVIAQYEQREYLIVGDKTGEVLAFDLVDMGRDPEVLLQHTSSIIMDVALSHDMQYLLTADRDEKIRVSQFPRTMLIEGYCLGHSAFIGALCLPKHFPELVLSLGGDASIRLWNFISCSMLAAIPLPLDIEECIPRSLTFCPHESIVIATIEEHASLYLFQIVQIESFEKYSLMPVSTIPLSSTPLSVVPSSHIHYGDAATVVVEMSSVPYFSIIDLNKKQVMDSSCPMMLKDMAARAADIIRT